MDTRRVNVSSEVKVKLLGNVTKDTNGTVQSDKVESEEEITVEYDIPVEKQ